MIITVLFILGLCLGSFANALVWRLNEQSKGKKNDELSITKGRSMCPHCKHELSAKDLVPVVSWISLGGKCRNCSKPIHWQYPLVEAATASLFVVSYLLWPEELSGVQLIHFTVWLICIVGFISLTIFDIRYMLLPNKIIFPLIGLVALGTLLAALLNSDLNIIFEKLLGGLIGGGIFYILFQLSDGGWIGGGDVKLGFLLGVIVGGPELAFLMLFVASLLGTIFSLPLMASGKLTPKTRIPFGPFLIIGGIVAQLFGSKLVEIYTGSLL
jgi:prepilin signal peptidase PulO-like enzyme (type II secretory pathway)